MHSQTISPDIRSSVLFLMVLSLVSAAIVFMGTPAMAAGSSSRSAPKGDPSYDQRKKANDYFQRGESYQRQGLYRKAAEQYEMAVKADESYAEAYSNLGYCYRKQGDFDRAIRTYQRAIQLKPDLAEAHEYIGEAYAETADFAKAEEHLQILQSLDPDEAAELEAFIKAQKANS